MTLLIKGMKMPKNGDELLTIDIWPGGKVSINLDPMCKTVGTAVEVPTPHGRLKDADELIKHDHQHYEHLSDEFYITVRDIENAPTVIEAEEA